MNLVKKALDVIFPPLCFGCGCHHPHYLCDRCWEMIVINNAFFCSACQKRVPAVSLRGRHGDRGNLFARPPCHPQAYLLAPATDYHGELLRTMIHQFKYERRTCALAPIERIMTAYLANVIPILKDFIIIPLPLSKRRQRERGFNQAELIARIVAENTGAPLISDALARIKHPEKKNSEMKNWDERQATIAGAFAVLKPELIAKKNIIIADDVFTSGATMNEAARILRAAGAKTILALTLARAR